MKTPDSRFYCPLISVGTITLDENESSHAVRVCRACEGDVLQLSDGVGHFADAVIEVADAKACVVRVDTVIEAANPRCRSGLPALKTTPWKKWSSMRHRQKLTRLFFCGQTFHRSPRTPT